MHRFELTKKKFYFILLDDPTMEPLPSLSFIVLKSPLHLNPADILAQPFSYKNPITVLQKEKVLRYHEDYNVYPLNQHRAATPSGANPRFLTASSFL